MKAAVYYKNGSPEVLKYEEVPDPKCHPHGVVIKVEAVSIEGGDTLNRWHGALTRTPHIVGYQAAGEIVEVGAEVSGLKVGQKVVTVFGDGSHAELRAVAARNAWPIPAGFDVKLASAIPVPFGTADDCLFEFGRLRRGETVLVQAGASGVGVAAIQLAKRAGATVLATASSDERLERLRPLGMDHGINYGTHQVAKEVMRLTEGKGANLVVDPVGGSTLQGSIMSLAYRGRISMVGYDGGRIAADGGKPLADRGIPGSRNCHRPRAQNDPTANRGGGTGRAEGCHRSDFPVVRGRRGPRIHREPQGGRARAANSLTARRQEIFVEVWRKHPISCKSFGNLDRG
jgi:NADPH2:quinone reductase